MYLHICKTFMYFNLAFLLRGYTKSMQWPRVDSNLTEDFKIYLAWHGKKRM